MRADMELAEMVPYPMVVYTLNLTSCEGTKGKGRTGYHSSKLTQTANYQRKYGQNELATNYEFKPWRHLPEGVDDRVGQVRHRMRGGPVHLKNRTLVCFP